MTVKVRSVHPLLRVHYIYKDAINAIITLTTVDRIQSNILYASSGRDWVFTFNADLSTYKYVIFRLSVHSESSANSIFLPVSIIPLLRQFSGNYLISVRSGSGDWCGISDYTYNQVSGWVNNPEQNIYVETFGIK